MARKDLERILAEDSNYEGVREHWRSSATRPVPDDGGFRKLRLAYTPRWHAFHSSAMARYEA
jgi:hypothetical protein